MNKIEKKILDLYNRDSEIREYINKKINYYISVNLSDENIIKSITFDIMALFNSRETAKIIVNNFLYNGKGIN